MIFKYSKEQVRHNGVTFFSKVVFEIVYICDVTKNAIDFLVKSMLYRIQSGYCRKYLALLCTFGLGVTN